MNDRMPQLRTVNVTRYVTPLREGGSLPAIVEADDGFLYVLKFRGAGQVTVNWVIYRGDGKEGFVTIAVLTRVGD